MDTATVQAIFYIVVLIMSVVVHEVSHGFAADFLGDRTARLAGRLTLNPIPHLDLLGSFIVPVFLYFSTGGLFMFGWAKPVPYNPYNLRNQRWGTLIVAIAGVLANFFLAVVFGLILRYQAQLGITDWPKFLEICNTIVLLNLVLGVFNLIPVPPLDGSKVLFSLLPYRLHGIQQFLETYWYLLVLAVMFFAWYIIFPIVQILYTLIVGHSLY